VDELYQTPELEVKGWSKRLPVDEMIFDGTWQGDP